MAETTQPPGPMKESAWAPLRVKAFRALWLAQVGSMIGTWMQTVGAQWLLVEEPGAEALVAMVQVAAMLPVLVLALPSGALADILDRRRMLIAVQLFQACVAVALAALTVADRMPPALLLTFTFLLGCGVALTLPAYQALIQDLVPRAQIRSAAALGGVAVNGARAVGPALAGLIIGAGRAGGGVRPQRRRLRGLRRGAAGPAPPGPAWRRPRSGSPARYGPAGATSATRRRCGGCCCGSACSCCPGPRCGRCCRWWRAAAGAGPTGYGLCWPRRRRGGARRGPAAPARRPALAQPAAVWSPGLPSPRRCWPACWYATWSLLAVLLVPAGMAWLWVLMSVTGALQVFLPGWVRARGLSMYNIVFAGGQAIGALLWGLVAQWWGLVPAFLAAAADGARRGHGGGVAAA